jgi:glycosyltransferase involved in cell wall biosynthesis
VRVAHLVEGLDAVGGVPTYLAQLLPALSENGVDNVVLTGDSTREFAGAACINVPAIASDHARLGGADRMALTAALRESRADVAYAHITRNPDVLRVVSEHMPAIFFAHDYYSVCPGSMRYLHRSERFCTEGVGLRCFARAYSERCTNRRPDRTLRGYRRVKGWTAAWPTLARVLTASQFVADVLAADGVPASSLRVVPYFVEAHPVRPPGELSNHVLFIGRLVAAKGVHVLLRALAQVDGASAVIAGDGPDRAALERLATVLGVAARVRFVGWVSATERDRLFASSRVLVVPSLWDEPFGIVGIEALAAGVPVVATEVGGIPSWLDDDAGVLVPPGDADALARALVSVVADANRRAELAARGPGAAARFSVERHLELLIPELEAVAASRA